MPASSLPGPQGSGSSIPGPRQRPGLTPEPKDIERPLGQAASRPGPGTRLGLPAGSVVMTLVAVAMLAASSAIALREKPFRDPARSVVSTPEVAGAAAQGETEPGRQPAAAAVESTGTPAAAEAEQGA